MASKILVAYATKSGSTAEIARRIGDAIADKGVQVDVEHIPDVASLAIYDAVILGAPMIIGWHREAVRFLINSQATLGKKRVAYFITALELCRCEEASLQNVAIFQDPTLGKRPKNPAKQSFKERQTSPRAYLMPLLNKAPQIKPISVALFKGKLDFRKLGLFDKLFVKLIIRAPAGDFRNWEAIEAWAKELKPMLIAPTETRQSAKQPETV